MSNSQLTLTRTAASSSEKDTEVLDKGRRHWYEDVTVLSLFNTLDPSSEDQCWLPLEITVVPFRRHCVCLALTAGMGHLAVKL